MLKALLALLHRPAKGTFVGRSSTRDVSYQFRMGAGFAGDINRVHPFDAEACLMDATNPPLAYGTAVLANGTANSVRNILATDQAAGVIYGFSVRPYPQQSSVPASPNTTVPFGAVVPPPGGVIDVLRKGYMMVKLGGAAAAAKGAPVFVWAAASAGTHVQGQVEAVATAGSTIALDPARTTFNGPADAQGIVELAYNI